MLVRNCDNCGEVIEQKPIFVETVDFNIYLAVRSKDVKHCKDICHSCLSKMAITYSKEVLFNLGFSEK